MTFDEGLIRTRHEFVVPVKVELRDSYLTWSDPMPSTGMKENVVGDLLQAFLKLERSTPDEMAAFIETYGFPELCHHGQPDRHEWAYAAQNKTRPDKMPKHPYCPPHGIDGQPAIWTVGLQRVARSFSAASRLGVALAARTDGDPEDWGDLQDAEPWWWGHETWMEADWLARRALLAVWLTQLLRSCGVAPLTHWNHGGRLTVTPEADGLMGTIALSLAYEIGQREGHICKVCGTPVSRTRPPLVGEGIYCKKPACKREQQRVNQRNYRKKKQAEKEGGL